MGLVAVERRERDALHPQDAPHDLPEAAEAGDDHGDIALADVVVTLFGGGAPTGQERLVQHQQQRSEHHRQRHRQDKQIGRLAVEDVLTRREREQHECKLASGRQREPETPRRLSPVLRHAREHGDRDELDREKSRREPDHRERLRDEQAEIGGHADGDEEQAEQQALERLEVRLELVPELAVRQQHAGQKGAQRHRQAGLIGEQRGCDDREQRCCRKYLCDPHARDDA